MTEDVEAERPWGRGKSENENETYTLLRRRPSDTGRGDNCISADVPSLHCAL